MRALSLVLVELQKTSVKVEGKARVEGGKCENNE